MNVDRSNQPLASGGTEAFAKIAHSFLHRVWGGDAEEAQTRRQHRLRGDRERKTSARQRIVVSEDDAVGVERVEVARDVARILGDAMRRAVVRRVDDGPLEVAEPPRKRDLRRMAEERD